jgi:NAD(P)-dependent dehydrogenase (short-subunit alcohol dehydrogenase family)
MNPTDLFRLDGKTALITGGNRGIGKAIARGFAAVGANVWIAARNEENGRKTAEEIGCKFVKTDLASSDDIQELVRRISTEEEKLDVLVNNAAQEVILPFVNTDMDVADQIWRVNVRAAEELTRLLLPLLKKSSSASIINVTSIHDVMPYPHNLDYNMSKAALNMFTKTLALELGPLGMRVNNLAPGPVETDINRAVIDEIGRDNFAEWVPTGRVAQVDEMIGPSLFLASEASSFVNGSTLYADGGYLLNLVRYRP